MAVREFTSGDQMEWSAGDLSGMTHGTIAFITKISDAASSRTLLAAITSAGGFLFHPAQYKGHEAIGWHNGTTSVEFTAPPLDVWVLSVLRKATGTTTPRRSQYNMNTATWAHVDAGGTIADWTALAGTDRMAMNTNAAGGESFEGRVAVMAVWSNEVHWTADGTGDTAIEAAGLEDSLQNWVGEAPDALWVFNQDPVSAVDDLAGSSDQFDSSGTAVVTGDDPPGFSFDLAILVPRVAIVAG
jgi:hypothetical protein